MDRLAEQSALENQCYGPLRGRLSQLEQTDTLREMLDVVDPNLLHGALWEGASRLKDIRDDDCRKIPQMGLSRLTERHHSLAFEVHRRQYIVDHKEEYQ